MKKIALTIAIVLGITLGAMAQWTGAGTQGNPYQIKSKEDLYTLATNVNSGTSYANTYFLLTNDLTYSYDYAWNSTNVAASQNNYTAIGGYGHSFQGHFDGGHHTISGIRIYKSGTSNSDQLQGVFGYLSGGSVRNLTVADASITGYQQVGAIAGCNNGTIEDCVVESNVGIYRIINGADKHGGIVGANSNGNVRRCISSATVKSHPKSLNTINAICGAIIGYQSQGQAVTHYVEDNVALNAIVHSGQSVGGAIIGKINSDNTNYLNLTNNHYRNCTINGTVNATNVGVGNPAGDMNGARSVHVLTLGADITATGESVVISNTTYYVSTAIITLEHTNHAGYYVSFSYNDGTVHNLEGNTFTMPAANATVSATLTPEWTGEGSQNSPYMIISPYHLVKLANDVNGGNNYADTYFKLGDDIDMTDIPFSGIGNPSTPFAGKFYGNNKMISNLTINSSESYKGLFGVVSGTVRNVFLEGASITCTGDYGGIIAGQKSGNGIFYNYYHNCTLTIDGNTSTTNIGIGGGLGDSGCESVYKVIIDDNVTILNPSVVIGTDTYCANHSVYVKLSSTVNPGYSATFKYNDGTEHNAESSIYFSYCYFTMPAKDNVEVSATLTDVWGLSSGADGTQDHPYMITTTDGLNLLARRVNGTHGYTFNMFSNKFFQLGANITYSTEGLGANESNYTPIGGYLQIDGINDNERFFKGTFDGNNKTVSGIRLYSSKFYQGLFGRLDYATVKNVILANSVIIGGTYNGGIAGVIESYTIISNCRVENDVTINFNSGYSGGIVGYANHSSSYVNGCISAATITGGQNKGGIIGYLGSSNYIKDCLFTGILSSSSQNGSIASYYGYIDGPLTNNYYTTDGVYGVPYSDVNGARRARTITLGEGVALVGDQTTYNVSGLTAIGTIALIHIVGNTSTIYSGATQNVTLDYAGTVLDGYTVQYAVNGTPIEGNTFEMPDENVTITATVVIDVHTQADFAPLNVTSSDTIRFRLAEDVVTTVSNINVGNSNKVVIDLNGKTLQRAMQQEDAGTDAGHVLKVIENSSLVIIDRSTGGTGIISGGNADKGGAVYVDASSSLTIKGGTIENCQVSVADGYGGAIYNLGTLTIHGGTIQNCTATSGRGRGIIYNNGTLTINGGVIQNNTAWYGGAIYNFNSCMVTINGGTIQNNRAVHLGYDDDGIGGGIANEGNLIINGGSITGNTCDREGGGIYASIGGFGVIFMNGNPVIRNNTRNSSKNNVYLPDSKVISVNGDFTEGACIGLTPQTADNRMTNNYNLYNSGIDPASIFFSDNGFFIKLNDNSEVIQDPNIVVVEIEGYGDGNDKWAFIASPVATEGGILPTAVGNIFSASEYDLYRLNPSNAQWENYKNETHTSNFRLVNGQGYLYATKETQTLLFTGAFNMGTTQTITLDQGYNLVGNPFPVAATLNRSYYVMNADGTGIVAEAVNGSTAIAPCTGVIVQATSANQSVTFTKVTPQASAPDNGSLSIALTQANRRSNALLDNAIVSFNEGADLGKFYFLEQDANIYISQGDEEYAIVSVGRDAARHVSTTEIPVNFKAHVNGEYTLTVETANSQLSTANFSYLHLIDNLTGANIDLLQTPSYTFTARNDDYPSRFKLVFANENDNQNENEDFAFISNGEIIINGEGTVQVIDMLGRQLFSKEKTSDFRLPTSDFSSGVYVLRLIDGQNVKTQKIVIR